MTAPVVTTVAAGSARRGPTVGDGTTARSRGRARWLRWRPFVLAVSIVLAAAAVAALPAPRTSNEPLEPDSVGPRGSRAVAQILGDQGVRVVPERRTADALRSAGSGGAATILVTADHSLSDEQLARLVASPADVVLLDPSAMTLERFFGEGTSREWLMTDQPVGAVTSASCTDPDASAAETLADVGPGFVSTSPDVVACFPVGGGTSPADDDAPRPSHVLLLERDGRRVVAVSSSQLIENDMLVEHGNAALALRTLGRHDTLVWYMPEWERSVTETGPDGSLTSLLPRGVQIALLQLLLVAGVAVLWRARRLGPVITEPLPVVVRGGETVRGRGRLYRRARAHGRAGAALRAGVAARCAARLGLPHSAGAEAVVDALSRASGRPATEISELLYGPPPTDDASLTVLTARLDQLESEVHRP